VLGAYRVIDLSEALLCGQILADLGADVIQVEPPEGSPLRRVGPFLADEVGPERSLTWWAYARGRRSIALDLSSADGRSELRRLVAGADFLVESLPRARLAELGLDRDSLEALNPSLVHVSVTPFGRDGPKADWVATDLISVAAGGRRSAR
jgi:crotonobetainyl-CoA:carnitine CoA-transferase CaiB-like acyl-CoA transferase